jgi:ABC-type transporter Mla MlaB component
MKPIKRKDKPNPAASADGSVLTFDLSRWSGITTAEFARLVLLRSELMAQGRDLRLADLSDQARILYEVCRLQDALPLGKSSGNASER